MICLERISIRAGNFGLTDVSLEIPTGAYGVLMGSTGAGKTTLIELICGLRRPQSGRVVIDGIDITKELPGNRGVGYVPQDGALFPVMRVRQQLGFALRLRGISRPEMNQRVTELAGSLGIEHLLDRKPAGLSGGERQRVALGRALAARPGVLLLDEPLSALDETLRGDMRNLLKSIHRTSAATVVHVTHDRAEANDLANVLLLLNSEGIHRLTPYPLKTTD